MKNKHPGEFDNVSFDERHHLPAIAGIYFAMQDDEVLYVGQSRNIQKRWRFHHKYGELSECENVRIHWIKSDGRPLLEQEAEWIKICHPPLNNNVIVHRVRRMKLELPRSILVLLCVAVYFDL